MNRSEATKGGKIMTDKTISIPAKNTAGKTPDKKQIDRADQADTASIGKNGKTFVAPGAIAKQMKKIDRSYKKIMIGKNGKPVTASRFIAKKLGKRFDDEMIIISENGKQIAASTTIAKENHEAIAADQRKRRDDEMVIIGKNGKPVTTSLIIAAKLEKQHKHILKSIEKLECSNEFSQANFLLSSYTDHQNRSQPMYIMTRDGFVLLGMSSFTGKKAMQWKEKYIAAFNRMETHIRKQSAALGSAALARGLRKGIILAKVLRQNLLDMPDAARLVWYRQTGLTQKEAAKLFGVSSSNIQEVEKALKDAGITLPIINANKRSKVMRDGLDSLLGFDDESGDAQKDKLILEKACNQDVIDYVRQDLKIMETHQKALTETEKK